MGLSKAAVERELGLHLATVRKLAQLTLVFDHRVCDGGVAAGFLRHVADCVEQPARLLGAL